jgi:ribosomal protein S18 acetylase RimI-like enzyme
VRIRRYRPDDLDAVVELWRRARLDAASEALSEPEADRAVFRDAIAVKTRIWVAEVDARPAAFMALAGEVIDRLYVAPEHQRQGLGAALVAHARTLSPRGLRAFTLQANAGARAFFEKHGFVAGHRGTGPPPESAPDVEYRWRP